MTMEGTQPRPIEDDRLEQIMAERYADLVRLSFLILHDQGEAEDATQLALERAWRCRDQLRSADGSLPWLRRIVVRESLRARSSPWWRLRSSPSVLAMQLPGDDESLGSALRLDLARAFRRLPADQSAVVVLHHYFNYPVSEVAEMVGAPVETVRSRLRLALRRLREELQDA